MDDKKIIKIIEFIFMDLADIRVQINQYKKETNESYDEQLEKERDWYKEKLAKFLGEKFLK